MAATFWELTERLALASPREKETITEEAATFLALERSFAEALILPLITAITRGMPVLARAEQEGFLVIRQHVYGEGTNARVAVGVAYLQDYRTAMEELDLILVGKIHEELQRVNLDFLVNDIAVNRVQMINGRVLDD